MKLWHLHDIDRFDEVVETLRTHYPSLHLTIEWGIVCVRGYLEIKVPGFNKVIDYFIVEIKFPPDYPRNIPIVREIDGRLEKTAERHFNKNETACLFFRDARHIFFPLDATFSYFMDKLVVNFFIWQIDYDVTGGKPVVKGMAHNTAGVLEYYSKLLRTDKLNVIRIFLRYLSSKKIRSSWKCYCGSGKRIRDCHLNFIADLRRRIISRNDIKRSYAEVGLLPGSKIA